MTEDNSKKYSEKTGCNQNLDPASCATRNQPWDTPRLIHLPVSATQAKSIYSYPEGVITIFGSTGTGPIS